MSKLKKLTFTILLCALLCTVFPVYAAGTYPVDINVTNNLHASSYTWAIPNGDYESRTVNMPSGHIFYWYLKWNRTDTTPTMCEPLHILHGSTNTALFVGSNYDGTHENSGILNAPGGDVSWRFGFNYNYGTQPDYLKPLELAVIDLTDSFGSGNEPNGTWCDSNLSGSYYSKTVTYDMPDNTLPTGNISGNRTSWAINDITLTFYGAYDGESGLSSSPYSFDGGATWQASASKTFSANSIIKPRIRDNANNIYALSDVNINKIDKTPPTATILGNSTAWQNTDVTITVSAADSGAGLDTNAYSFDSGTTWQSTNTKVYTANTSVNSIKVKDSVGNIYTVPTFDITKIDKTLPTATISGNPTTWQNTDVTLTISAADSDAGLDANAYSFDGGTTWQASASKTFSANSIIKPRIRDNANNIYALSNVNINKIDKTLPTTTISGNPTAWQNTDVTITVSAADSDAGLDANAYSFDGGTTWQSTNIKVYADNTSVSSIKVKDSVGNIYTVPTFDITKIDKTPPTATISGNPTTWQNTDVTLTISAADSDAGLDANAYSFDGGTTWQASASRTFSANSIIKPRIRDNVNNIYALSDVNINKIDKTPPTAIILGNPTEWQNTDVTITVSATDSDAGLDANAYSFDGGTTWQRTNTKVYTANTSVSSIKVKDSVGNIYTVPTFDITKIDKGVPEITEINFIKETKSISNFFNLFNQNVIVEIIALDISEKTNSSINTIYYQLVKGTDTLQNTLWKEYDASKPPVISTNFKGKLFAYATDNATNKSTEISKELTVENEKPKFTYKISTEKWTNKNVTISVKAVDDISKIHHLVLPDDSVIDSDVAEFEVSTNGKYNFYAYDNCGNSEKLSVEIKNIDTTLPTASIKGNPKEWQNTDVTITVSADDSDAGLDANAYSFDSETTWQSTNTKVYAANTSVSSIKVKDSVGNIYTVPTFDITKIDKTLPTATISGNPTTWQNTDVTITVSAADSGAGLDANAYSFDSGTTWQRTNTKVYTANTSVSSIKVKDSVGNIYTVPTFDITKIDKTPPTVSIKNNPKDWQNTDVTITVSVADSGAGLDANAYSFDGGTTWQSTNTKVYTANTSVSSIKVKDSVGNIYTVPTFNITKIDKTLPTATISGNPTTWQNTDVTITVSAADSGAGLDTNAYSFDSGTTWQSTNTKVYTANTSVSSIKVKDSVGNIYTVPTFDITKIDKTPPTATISGNPTTWQNTDVTLTISAADSDAGLDANAYSFDGGTTWQASASKTFSANSIIKPRIRDNANNIYALSDVNINKIDKTPPTAIILGNPTAWQNTDVTITVSAADSDAGLDANAYSFDGGTTWQRTNTKVYIANTSVSSIKVKDSVGNIYTVPTFDITKIDKTLPTAKYKILFTKDEFTTVEVIAKDTGSGIRKIVLQDKTEILGKTTIEFKTKTGTNNNLIIIDNAGNKAKLNIDLTNITLHNKVDSTPKNKMVQIGIAIAGTVSAAGAGTYALSWAALQKAIGSGSGGVFISYLFAGADVIVIDHKKSKKRRIKILDGIIDLTEISMLTQTTHFTVLISKRYIKKNLGQVVKILIGDKVISSIIISENTFKIVI